MGDWWRVILMFVIGGGLVVSQKLGYWYMTLKGTDMNLGWLFLGLGVVLAVIELFSGKKKKKKKNKDNNDADAG